MPNLIINIIYRDYYEVPLVTAPDNPNLREKLVKIYSEVGFSFCSLIHPSSKIPESAQLGCGILICHGANISCEVKIAVGANIMHDIIINKFSTIAPNAVVLGRVNIGRNCYVGANSTILPDINISDDIVIAAGSVVTKNLDNPGTYVGIPAKKIKK